jgi:cytochrome c oxidase cbb3-type subunit 4
VSTVSPETIRELQSYGYIFAMIFLSVIMYSYLFHLYRAEKKGTRNYEKYGKIALQDNLDDAPIEARSPSNKAKE